MGSISAHAGRVNTLIYDPKTELLFSGSHDGKIKIWSLNESLQLININEIVMDDEERRITCLAVIEDYRNLSKVEVVYGTQKGEVGVILVKHELNGGYVLDSKQITSISKDSMINALITNSRSEFDQHSCEILIGHSLGLSRFVYFSK